MAEREAARAAEAAQRVSERLSAATSCLRLDACVDEVFGQGADDAISPGINLSTSLEWRAVCSTPQAEALMTAVTSPDRA